jgi:hypothetical protein
MSYIYINLFSQRDRAQLNPDEVIVRVREHFPEAIVLPGDQLAFSAQRAEKNLDLTNPANRAVVQKLWRDSQQLGPAYAFHIPARPGPRIEGVIKRYQADFHSDAPFPEGMRARVFAFLGSLIPPGMAIAVCEESDEETAVVQQN